MITTHKRSPHRKRWDKRKYFTNPLPDVICIVALTLILLLTGYMHVPMAV